MQNSETVEVSVLSKFDATKNELITFVQDYKNLVVTESSLKDAIKARAAIREKRYAIQAQQKSNDDKRIAWNKQAMADNKANAEELLAILLPVEEPIDQKIKEFEAKKEEEKQAKLKAEQERIDARIERIVNTGAVKNEISYVLGDAYIAHEEFASLSDNIFDRIVLSFETAAKTIAEEKAKEDARIKAEEEEKERKRLADEAKLKADQEEVERKQKEQEEKDAQLAAERAKIEEEKKAIREEKVKSRKTALFNLGMAATADGFVFANYSVSMKSIEETENWDHHFATVSEKVAELKAEKEAELKAAAEREAKIQLVNNRIEMLIANGYYNRSFGQYSKQATKDSIPYDVSVSLLESLTDSEFNERFNEVERLIESERNALKMKSEADAKLREEKEAARLEALRPDIDKLNDFIKSLGNITGPELTTEQGRGILEHAISQIRDTQAFIRESLTVLKPE